jgi:hypothetical protein
MSVRPDDEKEDIVRISRSTLDETRQRRLREFRTTLFRPDILANRTTQLRANFRPDNIASFAAQVRANLAILDGRVPGSATHDRTPSNHNQKESTPPINTARILAVFMSEPNRDSFLGDLEERYAALTKTKGRRAASRWFWRQVVHSFFSLAFDALKRLSGLEKLLRRIGS